MLLALAHQPAVRVAQIALRVRSRRLGRRLRMLALGTTAGASPAPPPWPRGPRAPLPRRASACASRWRRAASSLSRKASRRAISCGKAWGSSSPATVRRLRQRLMQRRDLAFQLGDQRARALIRHRTMLAGVGLELGAVNAHQARRATASTPWPKAEPARSSPTPPRSSPAGSARSYRGRGDGCAATKRTPISRCVARSIRRLEKIPLA